jgi:hypothetical protein
MLVGLFLIARALFIRKCFYWPDGYSSLLLGGFAMSVVASQLNTSGKMAEQGLVDLL